MKETVKVNIIASNRSKLLNFLYQEESAHVGKTALDYFLPNDKLPGILPKGIESLITLRKELNNTKNEIEDSNGIKRIVFTLEIDMKSDLGKKFIKLINELSD